MVLQQINHVDLKCSACARHTYHSPPRKLDMAHSK